MFSIDITEFLATECMRDFSASVAEIGPDAGRYTWASSMDSAEDWQFLDDDTMPDFLEFVRQSGGWTENEISRWSPQYVQALCLQWIAGDVRECGADSPDPDWDAIRRDQEVGHIPSTIYRQGDRIYWECPV